MLTVEIVAAPGEERPEGLARHLADAASQVLESRPQGCWVRLSWREARDYAESAGGPPDGVYPVFCTVLLARRPRGERLRAQARQLTTAIAEVTGRPADNVHLLYEPQGAGRVVFGGTLVD